MKLDRELQRNILEHLKIFYILDIGDDKINDREFAAHPHFAFNMKYLHEHGLITGPTPDCGYGARFCSIAPNITKEGIDFLEDDGGISAILRTVTIRLDADNIHRLIENKIIASSLPESQKKTLTDKLKGFSSEALKHLTLKLLEKGLDHPDILFRLIGTL